MRVLALDLSKSNTGWACWGKGDEHVASGTWQLGSAMTPPGQVFGRLHGHMSEVHALGAIDAVFFEQPLNLGTGLVSTPDTIHLLVGLAAHAESWGEAMGCRIIRSVHQATWRRHFLGKMPRATKSAELKDYAMARCRALGFRPQRHDQAEAIGLLDYALNSLSISRPWAAERPGLL